MTVPIGAELRTGHIQEVGIKNLNRNWTFGTQVQNYMGLEVPLAHKAFLL